MTQIVGTAIDRTNGDSITVTAGVTSGMTSIWVLKSADSTNYAATLSKSGATFTQMDARAATNMYVTVIKATGLVAGNTVLLTQTTAKNVEVSHFYQDQYDYTTASLSAAIRGSSVATCVTGSITPASGQKVAVLSCERSTATGTTVSSVVSSGGETVTQDTYAETSGITATSTYLGTFTASAASARTVTVTYSGASTNGYAAAILTTPTVISGAPATTAALSVTMARSDAGAATLATTAALSATASAGGAMAVVATTTTAISASANTSSPQAIVATTTAALSGTADLGTAMMAAPVTTVAISATATTSAPMAVAPATTAALSATASAAGAKVVIGTAIERTNGQTVTVPAGVTSSMVGLFVVGNGTGTDGSTTLTKSGATFTSLDSRAAGNTWVNVIRATGLVAGDTVTVGQTSGAVYVAHTYQDQYDFITASLAVATRGSSVATNAVAAATPAAGRRVVLVSLERTVATGTTISSVTSTSTESVTQDTFAETTGSTSVSIYLGDFLSSAAASRTITVTYNSASTNGYIASILTAPLVGVAYTDASTTAALVSAAGTVVAAATMSTTASLTATATLPAAGSATLTTTAALAATANTNSPANVYPSGYASVTAMLADSPNIRVAHRGGSLDWPEMSFYAYQQSVNRGVKVLEVSLARTSDGVWFGLHDDTLDRTSGLPGGTNLDPSTITWATLTGSYQISAGLPSGQTAKPYMRIEQLIAAYGSTHVFFFDPKNDVAHLTELLDLLDTLFGGSCTSRVVLKYYGVSGMTIPNAAAARGIKTWGYFYETDSANFAVYHARWDILGLDYTASSGSWTTFVGYGQPLLGHIIPSASALATTRALGADGAMVSGVLEAIPLVGLSTAALTTAQSTSSQLSATRTTTAALTATVSASSPTGAALATTVGLAATAVRSAALAATLPTTAGLLATASIPGVQAAVPAVTASLVAVANTSSPVDTTTVVLATLTATATVILPTGATLASVAQLTATAATADLSIEAFHAGVITDLAVRYHAGTLS